MHDLLKTDLREIVHVTAKSHDAISSAGFITCAGYLSAIFEQLRSEKPLTDEQFREAFLVGHKEFHNVYETCMDVANENND